MAFIGDIKLDSDGNTVIENGQMAVTDTNIEFVIRELRWSPGSWKDQLFLGFGMDRYIGEVNNDDLIERILYDVPKHFTQFGILVTVDMVRISEYELGGKIELPLENKAVTFIFNINSGIFDADNVIEEEIIEEDTGIGSQESDNIYLNRR